MNDDPQAELTADDLIRIRSGRWVPTPPDADTDDDQADDTVAADPPETPKPSGRWSGMPKESLQPRPGFVRSSRVTLDAGGPPTDPAANEHVQRVYRASRDRR